MLPSTIRRLTLHRSLRAGRWGRIARIKSAPISGISYHPPSRELRIRFRKSNALYRYSDVPANVHREFVTAESRGKFFNSNIRKKFEYVLVG